MHFSSKFPNYKQLDSKDCGPTCLKIVAKYYGKSLEIDPLRINSEISKDGVNLLGISKSAEKIGFKTIAVKIPFDKLKNEAPLPCIIHWNQKHFAVIYKITKKSVFISDPSRGLVEYNFEEFKAGWNVSKNIIEGVALLIEPTYKFFELDDSKINRTYNFSTLFKYINRYKSLIIQLFIGLITGSLLQLIFPFLTQSIVDIGINTRNIEFIYLVLIAQIMLFAGRTSVEFIRSWILLHISIRINVSIISDFLIKLMKLPLSFFDTKHLGDILQRINDHHRIETFFTGTSLNVLFSLFNLVIFGVVLAIYSMKIFLVFFLASILYVLWVMILLNKRKMIDIQRFDISSKNQSALVQLIHGMQEIKLNNCEDTKRWEWESIQAKLFKMNIKSLSLSQKQQAGAFFINESKNIFITFLAAKYVLDGNLTLGAMLAIQYIIGQLNSPIDQLVQFIQSAQDAKLSLERLNEIHQIENEEPDNSILHYETISNSISLINVKFNYPGTLSNPILNNINFKIQEGKTTAIVGMSGSGKTTLLKLLLKFYVPTEGSIQIGNINLKDVSSSYWRSKCGVVMQDGFIFSDTIARNIAVGSSDINISRLRYAINAANIDEYIGNLPLGLNTIIGEEGNGISQGQRQRILIARAIYKNPEYLFFDEATNALDSNNEKIIMENLSDVFKNKTVVIVAHRLSTVKNADQIIVLDRGEIVEIGSHDELIKLKGNYYNLVINQLELAN